MASTPRQLIDQSVRHSVYLERLKTHEAKEFTAFLERMTRYLRSEIAGANVTDWTLARLRKQLTAIRATLGAEMGGYGEVLQKQIIDLAAYESGFEVRSLNQVLVHDFTLPSETQLKSAVFSRPLQAHGPYQGQLLESFIDGWSARQVQRVEGAIRIGYAQGRTTPAIVRDLTGVMDLTKRDVEAMTRTALQHSAAMAREITWQRNSDVIKKVRIVATLDGRTSTLCRSLDGREFPVDSGPRPPFHVNCRTTTTAVLDDRFAFLDEGGTRSARDAEGKVISVPANENYYTWLRRQPAAFQDSVIGPTRGNLLRNGGLTSERFAELQLHRNFAPASIQDLRKWEPLAFEKAGI